jgi:hypothetical protein
MAIFVFANNAQSTLAGSISNTDLVCNVQAGGGALFPNPGAGEQFEVTFTDVATGLIREIVYCTSRSGDTFTIVRAQEGTVALNWQANDLVANLWTAGQAGAMLQSGQAQSQSSNYAADVGVANAYVATYNPSITSPILGMPLRFKALNTNTGASTFNPGSGAGPIRRRDGSAFIGSEILAGDIIEVYWQGAYYALNNGISPATAAAISAGIDTQSAVTPAQLAAASSPQGPSTSVQFNNGGVFGGSANFTFNGTNLVTLAGQLNATTVNGSHVGTWAGATIAIARGGTGVTSIPFLGGANGYLYLVGGVMLQWGQALNVTSSANVGVTFPIAFAGGPYSIVITQTTIGSGVGSANAGNSAHTFSLGGFVLNNGQNQLASFNYIAIGAA